ncbi:Hypotetical protein [Gulosibacter molinativorax]|nr:Hypotetical protein [Gulosibacter molinativorax]
MGSEGTTVAALAVDGYPRNVPHAGKTSENSKWHAEGTAPLQSLRFRMITRPTTRTGTSKGPRSLSLSILESVERRSLSSRCLMSICPRNDLHASLVNAREIVPNPGQGFAGTG